MGLLSKIKDAFNQNVADSAELAAYRQMHGVQTRLLRQWYRLLNEANNHVGFEYTCTHGTTYTLLSITDWMRVYKCPTCGDELDLLKFCNIPKDTPTADWPAYFAKLPAKPRITKRSPYVDTWGGDGGSDTVQWAGAPQTGIPAGMK